MEFPPNLSKSLSIQLLPSITLNKFGNKNQVYQKSPFVGDDLSVHKC